MIAATQTKKRLGYFRKSISLASHNKRSTLGRKEELLRIAILTPSLDPRSGGIERFCADLGQVLEKNHQVLLIEPAITKIPKILRLLGLDNFWRTLSSREQVKSFAPDLIVTNRDMGLLFLRVKRIHVIHGTMVAQKFADRKDRKFRDWLVRGILVGGLLEWLSCLFVVRIAVSDSAATEVRRFYFLGVHYVIPNGINLPKAVTSMQYRRKNLLFVGRPESRKGYVYAKLVAASLRIPLRVAGQSVDHEVVALGLLNRAELKAEYDTSFGMILPSKHEACSYAILEALARGCPVFTTRVGWILTLIENVPEYARLTVPSGNEGRLAEIIQGALANPKELDHVLAETRSWMKSNCDLNVFSQSWSDCVQKIGLEFHKK
jgi:glycosyltransferase involved in cell wall biosynthesis